MEIPERVGRQSIVKSGDRVMEDNPKVIALAHNRKYPWQGQNTLIFNIILSGNVLRWVKSIWFYCPTDGDGCQYLAKPLARDGPWKLLGKIGYNRWKSSTMKKGTRNEMR